MIYLRTFFYLFICLVFVHCTSTPPETKYHLPKSRSSYYNSNQKSTAYNDIDILQLVDELNLNPPISSLGYKEKSFNTCQIKSNQSETPFCQRLYLGVVNFQVMCRQSTGTVQKVNLVPLHSQSLRWKSAGKRGRTQTNPKGYGQVSFISKYSSLRGHLYLYLGSKIARKRFHDQWKLILPKSWCLSE